MDNPKETHKEKFQKDKLHYNKNKRKAQQLINSDYHVDNILGQLQASKDLSQEDREKLEKQLKQSKQKAYKKHFKDIANRIKYPDSMDDKEEKEIWDYDFPLK